MKISPANQAIQTDCLDGCRKLSDESVDLIYLDPPFYTQKEQRLTTRDRKQDYSFSDKWSSSKEYKQFIEDRLIEFQRILSVTGSIFYHCDRKTTHIARQFLDRIIQLTTERGDTVLDPFCGSGTTLVLAKSNELADNIKA